MAKIKLTEAFPLKSKVIGRPPLTQKEVEGVVTGHYLMWVEVKFKGRVSVEMLPGRELRRVR